MTAAVMARVETANQVAVTSYVVPEVCATGVKVHVVATGGYARLIARRLPEIDVVRPNLTLEGLRIVANLND